MVGGVALLEKVSPCGWRCGLIEEGVSLGVGGNL